MSQVRMQLQFLLMMQEYHPRANEKGKHRRKKKITLNKQITPTFSSVAIYRNDRKVFKKNHSNSRENTKLRLLQ